METLKSAILHVIALLTLAVTVVSAGINGPVSAFVWFFAAVTFIAIIAAFIIDHRLIHGNVTRIRSVTANGYKIQKYMLNLIQGASSVAMFTKDMSWTNSDIESALSAKARGKSLVLALPAPTQLSEQLLKDGARVYYYGDTLSTPIRARFTLINLDSQSLELAIGKTVGSTHTIQRYSSSSDSPLLLANELLRILQSLPMATESSRLSEGGV